MPVANSWQLIQLLLVLPATLTPLLSVLPMMDKVSPAQSYVKVPLKPGTSYHRDCTGHLSIVVVESEG